MITLEDVLDAKTRIDEYIIRTPLLRVPALDKFLNCQVYLKPENLQYTGSFKLRGATNSILALSEEEKERGVVCSSSGNHAQGLACAANRLGIKATIVMPENCNPIKLENVREFGAEVLLVGKLASERDRKVKEIVKDEKKTEVHPYADKYVKAGQGTMALEILEDEPDMDIIVAPIGGGGLISGVSVASKGKKKSIRIIGAEPEGARRYGLSLEKGEPIALDKVDTIADGTRTDHANPSNFEIISKYVDDISYASDDEIRQAMKLVIQKAKIVAEPSSVLGIAAVINRDLNIKKSDKVCFVISGGNNDLNLLREILL